MVNTEGDFKLWFVVSNFLSWILQGCDALTSGSYRVYNSGGYVARFSIRYKLRDNWYTYYSGKNWKHLDILSVNNPILVRVGDFPVGQDRYLELPYGAGYSELIVEKAVFFGMPRSLTNLDITSFGNLIFAWKDLGMTCWEWALTNRPPDVRPL